LSTEIFVILSEGNGEFSLLKFAIVVCPFGLVYVAPPSDVPNHLLFAPSTAIAETY